MYIPKTFEMTDEETIFDFIEKNSFGVIISRHDDRLFGTHLPFVPDRANRCLTGHFAKQNEQWQDIEKQEVLVIFQGPHHYISPSWYETHQAVPTWNYVAVHVYGSMELIHDPEALMRDLRKMVDKYEGQSSSYRMDESNQAYIEKLMGGLVGFNIKIHKLEGKWKLSQNQSKERQTRVMENLEKWPTDDAKAIAEWMRKNMTS